MMRVIRTPVHWERNIPINDDGPRGINLFLDLPCPNCGDYDCPGGARAVLPGYTTN